MRPSREGGRDRELEDERRGDGWWFPLLLFTQVAIASLGCLGNIWLDARLRDASDACLRRGSATVAEKRHASGLLWSDYALVLRRGSQTCPVFVDPAVYDAVDVGSVYPPSRK